MKAIIVDDERNARENLQTKLRKISQIEKIALFADPLEAFAYTRENPVDVAFLDIEMYEMTGLEMAKQLKEISPKINVIFVTGYPNYALEAFDLHASGYLLKPVTIEKIRIALENLRYPVLPSKERVRIQTFGNFEVFVDGKPLQISRSKAKEMLAYLVDKRGTSVTTEQITALLWEDRKYDRSIQKQTQTVISQLMKILREAGIGYIILKSWNNISVDVTKFDCDCYRFMDGDINAINAYTGEYMNEYSWAEMTAGMLTYKK